MLFFFFSSRRRHTSSKRDWSSDVCSSDLCSCTSAAWAMKQCSRARSAKCSPPSSRPTRSEERRVGKECRSRWSGYHQKKKKPRRPRIRLEPQTYRDLCKKVLERDNW